MTIKRQDIPLQWAGGYTLHTYCDRDRDSLAHRPMGAFVGETRAEAKRQARAAGWVVRNDRTCTCPVCVVQMEEQP